MNLPTRFKHLRFFGLNFNSPACKCMFLLLVFVAALVSRAVFLPKFSDFVGIESLPHLNNGGKPKFLEVPQIVWGLNNQKIAFARACLTARTLNRTLVMPSLSASLFYKEVDQLKPISFDKVFHFEKFNSLCKGFVQLGRYPHASDKIELIQKGSGRKWTVEKDREQLQQLTEHPYNEYGTIRILGKNPFLWHDHWPVKDYAKVFECLVLVEEISNEADKVVSKIRKKITSLQNGNNLTLLPYVAVHMRIEKDWMIHCKKLEQRLNVTEICSSKEQIIERVGNIAGLKTPIGIYLAVADDLLEEEDNYSILGGGWKEGLIPFEKKKLGVFEIYKKRAYLIRSAIDYEVCVRSDVFVGNSFSTFSSLVVLDRTQKMITMGLDEKCGLDVGWPSYAYNLQGESKDAPRAWAANMSDSSLRAISYGSNRISCP